MQVEYERIAVTMSDGQVFLLSFVTLEQTAARLVRRKATDEAIQAEIDRARPVWRDSLGLEVTGWARVAATDVPPEIMAGGAYRNAWEFYGGRFSVNMDKARAERLERLRRERVPALEKLDREWMRAMGQRLQGEANVIEDQRQRLRDAPTTLAAAIAAATSLEELKAIALPE